jgi:dTDP-glucose 4,6-dehydratase
MGNFVKRILVTGGCGFIGNHLVRHLVRKHKDWLIINFDSLSYAGVVDNLKDIENEENYRFEYGDVTDEFILSAVFANYDITDVIHLAAESHVDNSVSAPMTFLFSNTVGTVTLLEAARQYWSHHGGLEGHKFYYFSTDEVFGFLNDGEDGFTEKSQIKPSSPYSASKAAGDLFVNAYFKTYKFPVVTSHMCNAIGGSQFPEKLVPATIERILNDEAIIVYDKGLQSREWIYTDDIVSAAETVFEKGIPGEAYNIGSGNECKNIDLVNVIISLVCEKTGKDENAVRGNIKYVENARPGHDFRYAINHDKITKELGWKPGTSLDESIEKTVGWYLENREWVENIKSGKYKENNEKYMQDLPW